VQDLRIHPRRATIGAQRDRDFDRRPRNAGDVHIDIGWYVRTKHLAFGLHASASGGRVSDISQQMRKIARTMTSQETDEAAAYCASQPPDIVKATTRRSCTH
jgi:hypothetical protein